DIQRELVEDYVTKVIGAAKDALNQGVIFNLPRQTHISVMAIQAANILMDMILSFKHPAFESEDEWRLVRVTRNDFDAETLKFRESDGQLTPYRPTFIYDIVKDKPYEFPLRSIGFGPSLEPGRTRATISLLLQHLAASGHPIKLDPGARIYEAGYTLRS
ncbi:MAG TPA: DUF2971 domain-containing protein, partial [Terriglobia bacterium]|nr:DUF2971 domain-containing protein [Terriglobia bacterium]